MGVPRLRSSLSISVAVHVLFFLVWATLVSQQAAKQPAKLTWIELDPVSPDIRKRLQEESARKRIVQTTPGRQTEEAAPDAFLGERNQTVDRETVSKAPSLETQRGKRGAQSSPARERAQTAPPASKDLSKSQPLSRFGLPLLPSQKKPAEPKPHRETGPYADSGAGSGAAPQDYIKGLKESETTALNTKEYVFYGYFQRIRERLDLAWTGILREQFMRIWRSGRTLASDREHVTKLLVTMNSSGEITRVQVLQESGTFDLDDAAVKAFNKAGPFPNPPLGMVDRSGKIEIRWDFVLRT